jgi:hypothetical protein
MLRLLTFGAIAALVLAALFAWLQYGLVLTD